MCFNMEPSASVNTLARRLRTPSASLRLLDAELLRDALGGYGTHDFQRALLEGRRWSDVRGAHAALAGPIQPCSNGSTVTGTPQRPSKRAASAAVPTMSP